MDNNELLQTIHQQSEEIVKLQVILYSLVDLLVKNNIVVSVELDAEMAKKVEVVNSLITDKKEEYQNEYLSALFNTNMGEA